MDGTVRGVSRAPFEIVPARGPRLPVVAHVPHAGTHIPHDVRRDLLLDDHALHEELVRMTDWHTDSLFSWLPDMGVPAFVNRTSRLVLDPERFTDDAQEPAAAVGQGVVYTRTASGEPLRHPDPAARAALLERYHRPYHAALTALVAETVERSGSCLVLDCHSFASVPLPSEPDQSPDRPDICIGTDRFHTPPALADRLEAAIALEGFLVRRDSPFTGALVPLRYHGHDRRVSAVMVEVRRGTYCDETTGAPLPTFDAVRAAIARAVATVLVPERAAGNAPTG